MHAAHSLTASHTIRGACVVGGMHGRGHAWQGSVHGRGVCMAGGVHGMGSMHGWGARGMHALNSWEPSSKRGYSIQFQAKILMCTCWGCIPIHQDPKVRHELVLLWGLQGFALLKNLQVLFLDLVYLFVTIFKDCHSKTSNPIPCCFGKRCLIPYPGQWNWCPSLRWEQIWSCRTAVGGGVEVDLVSMTCHVTSLIQVH